MKNFYNINEPLYIEKNNYYKHKRETVLETIKPICDAFEITDYDYLRVRSKLVRLRTRKREIHTRYSFLW